MDTRYFDHEFTEESICVTPPGKSTSQTNKQTNKRTGRETKIDPNDRDIL